MQPNAAHIRGCLMLSWLCVGLLVACGDDASPVDASPASTSTPLPPPEDKDLDGYYTPEDCDDTDKDVHPDALETCNGVDDNCNDQVDEGELLDPPLWYADGDGDGYGDPGTEVGACSPPDGYVDNGEDCDDTADDISPAAEEICGDGIDNNCDGTGVPCGLTGNIDLSAAAAAYSGVTSLDRAGIALALGGDLDGDGAADIVLGATGYSSDPSIADDGGVFVFLGSTHPTDLSLEGADVILTHQESYFYTGQVIASGGDITGDGRDDLVIGTPNDAENGTRSGAAWVVPGPFSAGSGLRLLDDAAFRLTGVTTGDSAGSALAMGDFNGDGNEDLAVGAWSADSADVDAGLVYVLYGPLELSTGQSRSLAEADVLLSGEGKYHEAGTSIASPGDVNGDGVDDLLIGAPGYNDPQSDDDTDIGAAYLVLGPIEDDISLADADVVFRGGSPGGMAGKVVAGAGDLDGDGLMDIAIAAPYADTIVEGAGAVYMFHDPVEGEHSLAAADVVLSGDLPELHLGYAMSTAGDLNGDGFGDLLVSTYQDPDARGRSQRGVYVLYGPIEGSLYSGDQPNFIADAASEYAVGYAIAGGGDVNGDSFDDILVGVPFKDVEDWAFGGAGYLFLGSPAL